MRTIVIGAGLAGLSAALKLLEAGRDVTLVAKGPGGLQLSQGSIDVIGYSPDRVLSPCEALRALPQTHPYGILGADVTRDAVKWLAQRLQLVGKLDENLQLPTAVGAVRPTMLAPESLAGADVRSAKSFAVVGIRQVKDFQADLVAGNLARTVFRGVQLSATSHWVDFEARPGEPDPSPVHVAHALDDLERVEALGRLVARSAAPADVILVPAVIGLHSSSAWTAFASAVGRPVAEVAMQPPSIPGIRMYNTLLEQARSMGVRHIQGALATGFVSEADRVTGITVASAGHPKTLACDSVVLAPGGFESGALAADSHGRLSERLFNLPLTADHIEGLLLPDAKAAQPLFEVGVRVDDAMRPLSADGSPVFANLHAAGGILAGAQRWHELSGDGIAVASGVRAATTILGGAR